MKKIAVHVKPMHNLLVGDENSTPISNELAIKLGLEVDGDYITVANTAELAFLEHLEKQNEAN